MTARLPPSKEVRSTQVTRRRARSPHPAATSPVDVVAQLWPAAPRVSAVATATRPARRMGIWASLLSGVRCPVAVPGSGVQQYPRRGRPYTRCAPVHPAAPSARPSPTWVRRRAAPWWASRPAPRRRSRCGTPSGAAVAG
uniref:Uncharacterized protein n=1 Tax=Streptomyces fradiae TaxID=1906 RepID=Q4A4B1_STRFR|nr:hypothetical protein [Streptomyces fradiae ATCC 10745 = DSM 40063]